MGNINSEIVSNNTMAKLQYISLVTTLAVLGLNITNISDANASVINNKQKPLTVPVAKNTSISSTNAKPYHLAQQTSSDKNSSTDDEMIDALQERQEKLENLKELKQLNKLVQKEQVLENLQEENFPIESLDELEVVQEIVNDTDLSHEEMLNALQEQGFDIENSKQLNKLINITGKINSKTSKYSEPSGISNPLAFRMLTIGLPATILVFLITKPLVKGLFAVVKSNYDEKFGKPKVPEGSVNLHARSFKEITLIGNKAEKINNEKFGNEEFLLLLRIKINMSKEAEGYQGLQDCVDLLQAGIIAQKSFLRLEQTELRYRSRKQQEFYQYVADNLKEHQAREAFATKVKQKQTEILPLITTEEGRAAIDTYAKEINVLSKYKLGLKLLALFKQYELKDFSILKNVADVAEGLAGKDLVNSDDLVSPVLENYESFEKLGPIIGISAVESTPQAYAKILQVIGLTNRHGKAYLEFAQLVELLKKWEKPYQAISLVRQEYTEDKYSIPAEFKEDIPGIGVYQKYAEYLPDL